jgi:hypothetical protein
MGLKRGLIALAMLALIAPACAAKSNSEPGWGAVKLTQQAAAPTEEGVGAAFGALVFRGGVELKSPDPSFGGWSSIKIAPDGRLLAVSDKGMWLGAKIETDRKGVFKGLRDARMALMRDLKADPLDGKVAGDAESLTFLADGRAAVSFEQDHRIWIYDLAKNGPAGAALPGPSAKPIEAGLGSNEGLEALTVTADGDLLAGAEQPGKNGRNLFRIKLDAKSEADYARGNAQISQGYGLVDLDRLPGGDFIALERFYFPIIGNKITVRRLGADGLTTDPIDLKGAVLAHFEKPALIDNFEGLAIAPLPDGAVRLYIMSDDNFSANQKTLIFAFDLPAPKPAMESAVP